MALSARVPDLAALEVLLRVARTGSLGRAAQETGVSQQAVSARIRAMEAQTGVTLVQRTARGSSLTAEGAVIAQWAARVLDVASELDPRSRPSARTGAADCGCAPASPSPIGCCRPGWCPTAPPPGTAAARTSRSP